MVTAPADLVARFFVLLAGGLFALSVMTMAGIHSLAVLGSIVAVIVVVWAGWVVTGRGR